MPDRFILLYGWMVGVDHDNLKPSAGAVFPNIIRVQDREIGESLGHSLFAYLFETLSSGELRDAQCLRPTT